MKRDEIKKIKFGNWPLPDEASTELGRLVALWNALETSLLIYIAKLSGFEDSNDMRSYIILNHNTFQQKLDVLSSLCDYLVNEYPSLSKYPDVISKLKTAQKQRNTFIHQHIIFNPETEKLELATGSSRGKLKTNVRQFSIEEIKEAVIKIDEANSALYELIVGKKIKPMWKQIVDGEKKF